MLQESGEGGKRFKESGQRLRLFEPVCSLFNSAFLSTSETIYVRMFYLTVVTISDETVYIDSRC